MGFVKDAWDGITGKTSAKAAEKAGQIQSDSSKYAADLSQKQYEQTRQDQMPWLNMGNAALQQLGVFTGISPQQPQQQQPQQQQAAPQQPQQQGGGGNIFQPKPGAGSLLVSIASALKRSPKNNISGGSARSQSPSAVTGSTAPQSTQVGAVGQANNSQGAAGGGMPQYTDKWGDRLESAYTDGKLTGGLDPNNFDTDPSYQFRKQQGMDGLQSSAAATGSLLSGAALKSMNEYNSNLASQEYGNAWQRDQSEKQGLFNVLSGNRSQDYGLWSGERARQYNELASIAGVGQQTAGQLGQFGANNAANQGNFAINGANAQANALMGSTNAKLGGMSNLLGLGSKALGMFI